MTRWLTKAEWEEEIRKMEAKLLRLREARDGKRKTRVVWRRGHTVKAHKVSGHYVRIIGRKV